MIDPWHIWTVIYMIDVRRIWNIIYNARSNRSHPPTAPNTAPATQNDCDDWSASHMKRHLQWAEQQESQSIFTKYCPCHAKWLSRLIRVTYETSFTMRGATTVTGQVHQILRLPRKMNLMIDPRHIWNVIYNARSMHRQPTSPNTAPATKSASSRLQRKLRELLPPIERRFDDNPTIIRRQSEHEIVISHPPLRRPSSSHLGDAFCMEKYNISRSGYLSKFHQVLRLPRKVTLQLHQILRLPRKMNLMIDPRHIIWNVIYNARSKQIKSPSNLTKYCACHEIFKFKIALETLWIASANIKTIRG